MAVKFELRVSDHQNISRLLANYSRNFAALPGGISRKYVMEEWRAGLKYLLMVSEGPRNPQGFSSILTIYGLNGNVNQEIMCELVDAMGIKVREAPRYLHGLIGKSARMMRESEFRPISSKN